MCDIACSDEDQVRNRRPGVEDRGWSSTRWVPSGRTIGRSSGTVCGLHRAQGDEERGILVWPQNQVRRFLLVWPQN
jgi:hypothetical protein